MKKAVHRNWIPPREWEGETAFILGSGRSIIDLGQDKLLHKLEGRYPAIACNSSFLLHPSAEVLFFADQKWLIDNQWCAGRHLGWYKVTRRPPTGRQKFPVQVIRAEHKGGISFDPSVIYGRNSGHMSLNLAISFGAKRIVLIGFDMVSKAKALHFHDLHSRPANVDAFKTWIGDLELAAPILRKAGVEVLNANPNSAIRAFGFTNLESWL